MWCVKHWTNQVTHNYAEIYFNTHDECIEYCERNKRNDIFQIIEKEWKEKKQKPNSFPLKMGLPIIVNSRYHLSVLNKK